jgi:GGDEF domain-containing protein
LAPIVRHHHEDYSGNGYPDGLKAEEIPVGSRILSIVDVFDALTSKRIYRGSMKIEKALEIMDNMQKTLKFDPKFYEIFRSNIDKFILTMNGFKNTQDVIEELQELDFLRNNFFFSDPLTKLLNRQAMLTILKQCSFNDLNITLAKLNIQNFRAYNKLYGSEKGDKLLFSVATHLKDGLKARVNIKEPKNNDMFLTPSVDYDEISKNAESYLKGLNLREFIRS